MVILMASWCPRERSDGGEHDACDGVEANGEVPGGDVNDEHT